MAIKVSTLLGHNTTLALDLAPSLSAPLETNNNPILNNGSPVTITGNEYPINSGAPGQVLTTNGLGILSWSNITGTGTVTSVGVSSIGTYAGALTIGSSPVTGAGVITITPNIFSTVEPGIAPVSPGGVTEFLRADGTWATPITSNTGTVTSVGVNSSTLTVLGTNPITTSGTFDIDLPIVTNAGYFTNANITIDIHGRILAASNGTGGSGGVTQLIAGTNITLSPPDGLGTVTINSSSAGLVGGSANEIPVMTGATTNTYIPAPSSMNTFLEWNGSSFVWTTASGLGTVTSVGLLSPGGTIAVSGTNPITSSGTFNIDLPASGVTASTYGSSSSVGVFTVNSRGITTLASNTAISITPAAAGLGNVTNSLQVINLGGAPSLQEGTGIPAPPSNLGAVYIDRAVTNGNGIYYFDGIAWQVVAQKLNLYNENSSVFTAPLAQGINSIALGEGATTLSTATDSLAIGLYSVAKTHGEVVQASGRFATNGDAQAGRYLVRNTTIDATPTELFVDGNGRSVRIVLQDNSTWTFKITITGHRTDLNDGHAGYTASGVIYRNSGATTTSILGSVQKIVLAESNPAWDIIISADVTDGSLKVSVIGEAGKQIRWVALVETVEITN